jgi:hypothetical protein
MVSKQPENKAIERRSAIRYPASGEVWLRPDGRNVEGRLLDRSATGFRVAYASGELEIGAEVDFVIGHQEGRARVVWNRFTRRHWESGLLILV